MNRLQAEQHRLYLALDAPSEDEALIDAQGRVRALVVEVAQQVGWEAIAALCQGIQDDLDLPAPAIAVSGGAGFQIWLSLAQPVPVTVAQRFLAALCHRFLSQVPARHVHCLPTAQSTENIRLVPSPQGDTGRWSAYVVPGLASVFADEPWLDVPPGTDAQAQLLCRLESISSPDFMRVQRELGVCDPQPADAADLPLAASLLDSGSTSSIHAPAQTDPRRFLLSVMNDSAVPMALRIEAAKALLPHSQ